MEYSCTATGVVEMLAGGVPGTAANCDAAFGIVCPLRWNSSGSLQLVVGD